MSTLAQRSVLGHSGQPLDQIHLVGIASRGFHGVLQSEREAGQDFSADVTLYLDTRAAARGDDLTETVNYAVVAQDVADILSGSPVNLIETVAEQIAAAVLARPAVVAVDVAVHKPQAPIPVPFADVVVAIHRDHTHVPAVASPVEGAESNLDALAAVPAGHEPIAGVDEPLVAEESSAWPAPVAPVAVATALPMASLPVVISRPAEPAEDELDAPLNAPSAPFGASHDAPLDGPLDGPLDAPLDAPLDERSGTYADSDDTSAPDVVADMPPVPFPAPSEAGEAETVTPPLGIALTAVLPPLDEGVLAEQSRLSEQSRRPEVFGMATLSTGWVPPLTPESSDTPILTAPEDFLTAEVFSIDAPEGEGHAEAHETLRTPELSGLEETSQVGGPADVPVDEPLDIAEAHTLNEHSEFDRSSEASGHTDPSPFIEGEQPTVAEPTDFVESTNSAEPADTAELTDLAEPTDLVEPTGLSEPTDFAEPAPLEDPVDLSEVETSDLDEPQAAVDEFTAPLEDTEAEAEDRTDAFDNHDQVSDLPPAPGSLDADDMPQDNDTVEVTYPDYAPHLSSAAEDASATSVLPRISDRMDTVADDPVEVVLALGANVGDAQHTLRRAVAELGSISGLTITAVGPLARTAPVGGPDQPDFLNTVVLAATTLSPRELLHACQSIEAEHGRQRLEHWGPRTLDIDLIAYGGLVHSSDDLDIPHPRANERAFVLAPWAHLSPDAVLPGLGGGPVGALAATAPDRDGIRWLALDWLVEPEASHQPATSHQPPTSDLPLGPAQLRDQQSDGDSASVPTAPPL